MATTNQNHAQKKQSTKDIAELTWRGPAVGLLDLDAFFTSVEQLDHPQWRGKPVIVGGSPEARGVVSTASYEARKFGIHSAQPSAVAKRLCPDAIWSPVRMHRYKEMSDTVMDIVRSVTPRVEQVSIDEAFFDITPGSYSSENPIELCLGILDKVSELGITASIGLASNKALAKIASELDKPQGFTVVPPGTEDLFVRERPLRALSGIGPAMEKSLHREQIYTLGQFLDLGLARSSKLFGKAGTTLYERLSGATGQHVSLPHAQRAKSLSHDETFPQDLTTKKEIEEAIKSIATEVGRRLRKKGLKGREVVLRLKYTINESHTAQAPLVRPTDNEYDFMPVALKLSKQLWRPGTPVRLVGVGLTKFDEDEMPTEQLTLDQMQEDTDKKKDRHPLAHTTDSIKDKFGKGAIQYGRDLRFKKGSFPYQDAKRRSSK